MLIEVEKFLRRTGMSPSRFGRAAANDPRLVGDLRNGRELRATTAARVRAFIAEYEK